MGMLLKTTEKEAVEEAIAPHMADIQSFFDGKPQKDEVLEYMAWAYAEICDKIAEIYARPCVDRDIPY